MVSRTALAAYVRCGERASAHERLQYILLSTNNNTEHGRWHKRTALDRGAGRAKRTRKKMYGVAGDKLLSHVAARDPMRDAGCALAERRTDNVLTASTSHALNYPRQRWRRQS